MKPTVESLLDELPYGDWSDAETVQDVIWLVRLELDLIDEGQDSADAYDAVEVIQIRRFLKRWEHLIQ